MSAVTLKLQVLLPYSNCIETSYKGEPGNGSILARVKLRKDPFTNWISLDKEDHQKPHVVRESAHRFI